MGFPGCRILLRVDRDVTREDGTVALFDTRYFLCSLDPERISAGQLLATVRAHWEIENSLFFVKDRWWDEDRHWTSRPGVSDWLAQLTSAAITALRVSTPDDKPLRARADSINWNPLLGLTLLGL